MLASWMFYEAHTNIFEGDWIIFDPIMVCVGRNHYSPYYCLIINCFVVVDQIDVTFCRWILSCVHVTGLNALQNSAHRGGWLNSAIEQLTIWSAGNPHSLVRLSWQCIFKFVCYFHFVLDFFILLIRQFMFE